MKTKITPRELEMLTHIKGEQNEQGHSDFISTDVECKSNAGVVSSLFKKNFIYDSYSNFDMDDFEGMTGTRRRFKMWCLTDEGADIVGKPNSWW